MAIIGAIRKRYWLLVLVIGVALLLFILSDFSRKGQTQETTLVSVNGEKVSIMEFNKKFDENIELAKINSGKNNLSTSETNQIRQSTFDETVENIITKKQFEELGISVSVEELSDLIIGNNPHPYVVQSFTDPSTGTFDKAIVSNFLQNIDQIDPTMKSRYLMLEKAVKDDRIKNKYNNLIGKSFYVPTSVAKRQYIESNETANAYVAGLRYVYFSDTLVSIDDKDYEKYYNENKYKFQQDRDARNIEYVMFTPQISEADITNLMNAANDAYKDLTEVTNNRNIASVVNTVSDTKYDSTWKKAGEYSKQLDSLFFRAEVGTVFEPTIGNDNIKVYKLVDRQVRPDSLRASHILVSYAGANVPGIERTMAEAEKIADSLLIVLKAAPNRFASVAATFNDDNVAKESSGDLDWFPDGMMVPEFNQAVFDGREGDIVKVSTIFGFHIVKITGKKDFSTKIRVAEVTIDLEPGIKSMEKAYNDASSFAASFNTLEKFEAEAKTLNMRTADRITPELSNLPGLSNAREIVRWAFNDKTKTGAVSNVFDIEGSYVVAALKDKIDKGTVPLSIVKNGITPLVMRDKKAEYILAQIEEEFSKEQDIYKLMEKFPEIPIDTVNVSFMSGNVPGFGNEPKLVGKIFTAAPNQLSKPIVGEQAVYVFILNGITQAPEIENFDMQKRQMASMFQGRAINALMTTLKQKSDIKDNSLIFF